MRKALGFAMVAAALASASAARATTSTTFWTPATTYTQPAGVLHITYDTWFGEAGALQIDTGLTAGILSTRFLQLEAGADLFFPTTTPRGQMNTLDFAQLNARATLPQGAFGGWSPGLSVGIANVGFAKDVSNYDLVHATLGWTTRRGNRFGLGAYYGAGSELLWTSLEGETRKGLMASWVSRELEVGLPGLEKIDFRLDLAAGFNWAGGLGAGIGLLFTPGIHVITGAAFPIDWDYYERAGLPRWLWSVQLDVDVDLVRHKREAGSGDPSPEKTPAPPESGTPSSSGI